MTYRLNVCLLSPLFEKRFGLPHFARDYTALLGEINAAIEGVRDDWRYDYRIFCKLCHFFDDFNFFINISLSPETTQARYSKFGCPTDIEVGLSAFILRVKDMKIPQDIKDSVELFLDTELRSFEYEHGKEDAWLVPDILHSKPKNFVEKWGSKGNIHEVTLGNFKSAKESAKSFEEARSHRAKILQQLSDTWEKYPELRLSHIIADVIPAGTDLFYLTDAK